MLNKLGREVPNFIDGYGDVIQFEGAYERLNVSSVRPEAKVTKDFDRKESKVFDDIKELIKKIGIKDSMTLSFHHHLRNGDYVTNKVMMAIKELGIKDIHVASSGLFPIHEPLVALMEDETITQISVSAFGHGPVTKAISAGKLKKPAILRTHGGRARAIESGDMHIDVAFIAAPSCDEAGNMNGSSGPNACGLLAYNYPDARYADYTVAVTDNLVDYPNFPVEISEDYVDFVLTVDQIGDPNGIASGAMEITTDPDRLAIAERCAEFLDELGYIKEGMSFQTGAGGISLAVADKVRTKMIDKNIKGSFGIGGIHAYFVKMLEEGLFKALLDVQCFDLEAIASIAKNENHIKMGASQYANPHSKGCSVDKLDIMILGGFEVDRDYNLNVITGSDGVIRAASGGNADTAAGSDISIVVSSLMKKGNRSIIRDKVTTVTTPGETVDAIVTDQGIAINPLRSDLIEKLKDSSLPIVDIDTLYNLSREQGAVDEEPKYTDRIVAVAEYRDGSVVDVIYQVEE